VGTQAVAREPAQGAVRQATIDADVHNYAMPEQLLPFLPERWRRYVETFGLRTSDDDGLIRARATASRTDSWPPSGVYPGGDEPFARAQLLDAYDIDFAVLNNMGGTSASYVGGSQPRELSAALQRANNEWTAEHWLDADPRWLSAISLAFEEADGAVAEITRCRESSDRWVQALVADRTHLPIGHERYWPIYEALAHYDIPLAIHPGGNGMNRITGAGWPSYYYEDHVGYPQAAFSHVASLICERVFDRWPTLKVVLVEGGWSWVVPFAWRMDASWRVLREEIPDLERKPSEYMRDHLWCTTQPIEEPERPEWFVDVFDQCARFGLADHLMFSTDYPHWDFDSPKRAVPPRLADDARRALLHGNAAALYGLGAG
jgi:predicted TIM-barrel fold metal-dependent hydrolase